MGKTIRMRCLLLAGTSLGYADGSMHFRRVPATGHDDMGISGLPLTREILYRQ